MRRFCLDAEDSEQEWRCPRHIFERRFSKMKQMSWDDLRLLLLIAEYESLNKASIASEISAATLGRRLLGLEQVLGQELFHRSNTGYVMTPFGQKIVHHAKQMQFAADQIIKMCGESKVRPNIRISAGSGTSRFYPELVQISEPLSHLEEDVYLVMLNDDRHRPTMRKAINRIVELFASSALE